MFGSQPPPAAPQWSLTSQSTADSTPSGSSAPADYGAQPAYQQQQQQQQSGEEHQPWHQPSTPSPGQPQRYDLYTMPPPSEQRYQLAPSSSVGTYWHAPPSLPPPTQDYAYYPAAPSTSIAYAYPPALPQPSATVGNYWHAPPPPPSLGRPPSSPANAVASSSRSKRTLEQSLADEHRERHGEIAAQHEAELRALRLRQAQWSHQSATGGHGILFGSTAGPEAGSSASSSSQYQSEPPFHAVWGGLSQSVYQPLPPPRGGPWSHLLSSTEPSYPTPSSAPDIPPASDLHPDPGQRGAFASSLLLPPNQQTAYPTSPSAAREYGRRSTASSDSLSPNPLPTFNLEPPLAHGFPPTAPSTGDSSRAPPLLQVSVSGPSRSRSPRHGKATRTHPSPSPPYDTPPKSPPAATPAAAVQNKGAATSRPTTSGNGSTGTAAGPAAKRKRSLCPNLPVARCSDCNAAVAHLLLRGEDEDFTVGWEGSWLCHPCMGIRREKGLGGVAKEATGSLRKRKRKAQDLLGLVICDVCLKVKGQGGVIALDGKSQIRFTTEFVCVPCDEKYKRCSDCGGGGGGRIGIGKWRSRQLFTGQRKTCCLTHTRIGEAALSFGVWDVRDFKSLATREALLEKCSARWRDRTLARLATPEVLESAVGPARTYEDVEAALAGGWPSREAIFEGIETPIEHEKRRFFGLTWCKTKPRRKYAADKSESPKDDKAVLIEKANHDDIIPPDHDLVGLFIGHWRINDGTLLLTTSLPFETSDGDDRAATAVGEMCVKITTEIYEENQRRLAAHEATSFMGPPLKLLPPLEHLWVLCDNPDSRTQERMRDHLVRRRDFHPLEDYLKIHPHVDRSIFRITTTYMPVSGPSWIFGGEEIDPAAKKERQCDILVRWLGPQIDQRWVEDLSTGTEPPVPALG